MTAPTDGTEAEVKNQHYVPQGYLRNFSTKDQIWAYDKSERRKFKTNVRNVAAESYFYDSAELAKVTGDKQFIEKFLRRPEGMYATIVQGLIQSLDAGTFRGIKPAMRHFMSAYMIVQMNRTKETLIFGQQMVEAFASVAQKANADAGLPPPSIEELFDGKSAAEVAREHHHRALLDADQIQMMAGMLYRHIWVIKRAYRDEIFLTSDHPVAKKAQKRETWRSMSGIGSEGIEMAFPLSSRYLLSLYERSHFHKYVPHDGQVKDCFCSDNMVYYNQFQIVDSNRYVFSKGEDFEFVDFLLNDQPIHGNPERPRVEIA